MVGIVTLAVTVRNLLSARKSEDLGENRYELLRDQRDRLDTRREERRMLTEELERESRERRQLTAYLQETDPRLMENLKRWRQARGEGEREAERLEEERQCLQQEHQRVIEELEQERDKRSEAQQWAEQLEHEREEQPRVQQDAERLGAGAPATRRGPRDRTRAAPCNSAASRALGGGAPGKWWRSSSRSVGGTRRPCGGPRGWSERRGKCQGFSKKRNSCGRNASSSPKPSRGSARRPPPQRRAEQQDQELARLQRELQGLQEAPERRRAMPAAGPLRTGARRAWWRRPVPVIGLLFGVLITWFLSLTVALSMLAS